MAYHENLVTISCFRTFYENLVTISCFRTFLIFIQSYILNYCIYFKCFFLYLYIYIYMDTTTDHFTPLALRVRGNDDTYRWNCVTSSYGLIE